MEKKVLYHPPYHHETVTHARRLIMLHLCSNLLQTWVWLRDAQQLPVNMRGGTLYADRVMRRISTSKQKIVRWDSHPVAELACP